MSRPAHADRFERDYAAGCGVTVAEFRQTRSVVPCECGLPGCHGWAVVPRSRRPIDVLKQTKQRRR